jgi:hypothetical protein
MPSAALTAQLDRTRVAEALTEFETEHDRILEAETRDLEDLAEMVDGLVDLEDPRNAHLVKVVALQEHAAERLREIRADHDRSRRHAFRRLRSRLEALR